jgi:predicted transglutaminase-like cysteine proteinase
MNTLFTRLSVLAIVIFCGLASGNLSSLTFADETASSMSNYFHIRQETSSANGVLVSRPQPDDRMILDLFDTNRIHSVEDYAQWLQQNIKYQSDARGDAWLSPQQTLAQKSGDCEDFAFLNSAAIRVLGYEPHFLALVARHGSHAVCVFKKNDRYVWLDNAKVRKTETSSLTELARQLIANYHYSQVLELDLKTHQWQTVYQGT